MNFFSIRTNHQDNIKKILEGGQNIDFGTLSWHKNDVTVGDIIFTVISGDSSKKEIVYKNGLRAIGRVTGGPFDETDKHFRISVEIIQLLPESLTKDDFYRFPELKNCPNIGPTTTNEPNQSFRRIADNQTVALIKAIYHLVGEDSFSNDFKDIYQRFSENFTLEVLSSSRPLAPIEPASNWDDFYIACEKANLFYDKILVTRFIASLLTKPFVILTGLSGSGKTKLAQAFVQWICGSGHYSQSLRRFTSGEEIKSERVIYKIIQSDFSSVTFEQVDSKIKVTLPYGLIYEWIEIIKSNNFDPSTPTRKIRDLVGGFTKYSSQLNSFESHLKVAAFELISRTKRGEYTPQFLIVPVGADWTNREPLLGYPNALKPDEYVKPDSGVLDLIIQANDQPDLPYFLILDEMNLSHVERYFADFLSAMESKEGIPLQPRQAENGVPEKLEIPKNLFIIGTVNIDETTNMFSPKVLDRANTIEFRVTKDEMNSFLANIKDVDMKALTGKGAGMAKSFLEMAADKSFAVNEEINVALIKFFAELSKTGAEFGYRSASEILRLIHQLTVLDNHMKLPQKIDIAIVQKLLPKLHGSQRRMSSILKTLGSFCVSSNIDIEKILLDENFDYKTELYPLSLEKIARMYRGALANGFTSFAEA